MKSLIILATLFLGYQSWACSADEIVQIAEQIEETRIKMKRLQRQMKRAEDQLYQCAQAPVDQVTVQCSFVGLSAGSFTSRGTGSSYDEAKSVALSRATTACMDELRNDAFCTAAQRVEQGNVPEDYFGPYHACTEVL